jgi:hypothetical protein
VEHAGFAVALVVVGDRAARHHAGALLHVLAAWSSIRAVDVVEIDVEAVRQRAGERRGEAGRVAMVDGVA